MKKKLIIIKLSGGLGNQLFQYFFGISLSKKFSTRVVFEDSFYVNNVERNLQIEKIIPYKIKKLKIKRNKYLLYFNYLNKIFFQKENNKVYQNINNIKPYHFFYGYWQNQKYFEKYFNPSDYLKFQIKNNYYSRILKKIKTLNYNVCFIHVRRGDYLNVTKTRNYHGICSDKYYFESIKRHLKSDPNLYFLVFSDNIILAKKLFINIRNIFFISPDQVSSEIDEMYLMSLCRYGILSNSSFSWWSAYLNFNSIKKQIISPKYWYQNKVMKNIVNPSMNEWTKIDNF